MRRTALSLLTACTMIFAVLVPSTARAAEPVSEPLETQISVSFPVVTDHTIYVLGQSAPLSATVTVHPASGQELPGTIAGIVEFFDGDTLLGSASLQPGATPDSAIASIETDRWQAAGARSVTAAFLPEDDALLTASKSSPRAYRVVDTERMIPDIELQGAAEKNVRDAQLEWTIANIWFSNFNVGFEREVVSGNVSLPQMARGSTIPELQAYYFRPFTFSGGSGETDAAGNRIISFDGTARLTSGSGNQWNFADPRVHLAANGDGYVTAEFSGFYHIGMEQEYAPVRVTIATFAGAELQRDEDGLTTAQITLNWEGQAKGAGSWALQHNASFPNEFVALLNPGINLFFAKSSVATDDSKIPHPISLSFREEKIPVDPVDPVDPEDPVKPSVDPAAPTLTPENENVSEGFALVSKDGRDVVVNVGADRGNTWIGVTLHSDPQFLGWFLADAAGNVKVTVPASVTGSHRLSYVDANGTLLGWVPISFGSDGGTLPVSGDPAKGEALRSTGAAAPYLAGGVALLLLVAGGALLVVKRRRDHTTAE